MYSPVQNAQSGNLMSFDPPFYGERDQVFKAFCKSFPNKLNLAEFQLLCYSLFKNDDGHRIVMEAEKTRELFKIFDSNKDSWIEKREFEFVWSHWLNVILNPVSCLLIIDVQNDFIDGSLSLSNCPAKHDAHEIIEPINQLIENGNFDVIAYTMDWHPKNHISFYDNLGLYEVHPFSPKKESEAQLFDKVIFKAPNDLPMKQKLWPAHCIQGTKGARLHPDLKIPKKAIKILKGTNSGVDSYSAFWDNAKFAETPLHQKLQSLNVTDLYICGIAWDYCVGYTALDALEFGYRTFVIEDCIRAITLGDMENRRNEIIKNSGLILRAREVISMINGTSRHPMPAYKLGLSLKGHVPHIKIRKPKKKDDKKKDDKKKK